MRDFAAGFGTIMRSGWRASPRRLLLLGCLNLLEYVSWPLAPLALKYVTDAVVERDIATATVAAAFLPVLALLNQVAGHVAHVLWVEASDLNVAQVNSELGELSQGSQGIEHHERPEFADRIELLRTAGNPLYMSVRTAVESMARALQLVVTVVMLALLQPVLLLLLVFAVPPLVGARWAFRRFASAVWGEPRALAPGDAPARPGDPRRRRQGDPRLRPRGGASEAAAREPRGPAPPPLQR